MMMISVESYEGGMLMEIMILKNKKRWVLDK
jgi:hypothetical protein